MADAPVAKELVYNALAQQLVEAGTANGGSMLYSTDGTAFSETIPEGVNAGTYTVWYKVKGNANYNDSEVMSLTVTIDQAELTMVILAQTTLTYNGQVQSVGIASVKAGNLDVNASDYTVSGNSASEVGTYTVTVTATEESNFTGSVTADFTITPDDRNKFAITVTDKNGHVINGATVTATIDEAGFTATIDELNLPASADGKELMVYIPDQLGNNDLTAIADNAFAGKNITDVFMPDTDEPIAVGNNAFPGTAIIHTSLALLDDYALMVTLASNYAAEKVMTTVTPANRLWTLGTGVDVIIPAALTVSTVKEMNNNDVFASPISEEELTMGGHRVVLANNGVLLEGQAGKSYDLVAYSGRIASGTAISDADNKDYGMDNCLEPVVEKKHYEPGAYFVLNDNQFRAILPEGDEVKVPAGKAVLHFEGSQSSYAPIMGIVFDDTITGISSVAGNVSDTQTTRYNLTGRRVQKDQKGLIIMNGKKTFVK